MYKIISYQEACNIDTRRKEKISEIPIFKEASERGDCEILQGLYSYPPTINILVKDDSLGGDFIGYLIAIYSSEIIAFAARESNGSIVDSYNIADFNLEESLSSMIPKIKKEINICPVCKKDVPFSEQKGFSFAGRCCEGCLLEMHEKYEYPGWYN